MDLVRNLILERLQELGLNMAEVSRRLGRNETYLQQFLKKGSPRELHERERIILADILKVPEDELRGPSTTLPKRNYEKNVPSRKSLVAIESHPSYAGIQEPKKLSGAELFGAIDFPIYGTIPSENGALLMSDTAVDWIARPPMLSRVQDSYGYIVSRDIMEPAIRPGSVVLVNPHLPPRIGDLCVFRSEKDGVVRILGSEYRGQTEDHWKARQYNPPKDFTLKKSDWTACHRMVGSYFP